MRRVTHGTGELAHSIVADIEIAEALAFDKAGREGSEIVVGESEPGESACAGWEEWVGGGPLDLGADDIDDFVGEAGNLLVAEVDGDAGLLGLLGG